MSDKKPFVILPVPAGMRVQYLVNPQKEVYARAEILGGPWEWEIGGHTFKGVLVKTPDNKIQGEYSLVDVRSGSRIIRVPNTKAPRRCPHAVLTRCCQLLSELETKIGAAEVARRIREAPPLPEWVPT